MAGSSSPKQQIEKYYMSIHLGLCRGSVDSINKIYFEDKLAWSGSLTSQNNIFIDQENLFGGVRKEGGVKGYAHFMPGSKTQVTPENLANKLNLTSATAPGYRGVTTLWFYGRDEDFVSGFYWRANNAFLPPVAVEVTHVKGHNSLGGPYPFIGRDMNPAHILWAVMTNPQYGRGTPAEYIDKQSFLDAAATLSRENFGLSIKWTKQDSVQNFLQQILNHIQGIIVVDPISGKEKLILLRNDYDLSNVKTFDPDNCTVVKFKRKAWGETINQIVVTWTNPQTEQDETVTAQDLANVEIQGVEISEKRDYYAIRNVKLAYDVASRDVRVAAAPLAMVEMECSREAWDLTVGSVFKLNYPELGIDNVVYRIGEIEYGTPTNPTIRIKATEDIFALESQLIEGRDLREWQDPAIEPNNMTWRQFFSTPYFLANQELGSISSEDLDGNSALIMTLGAHNSGDVNSFDLLARETDYAGRTSFVNKGVKTKTTRANLGQNIGFEEQTRIREFTNVVGDPIAVGDLIFTDSGISREADEVMLISGKDNQGWWIVDRGMLDTVPKYHPQGRALWFVKKTNNNIDLTRRAVGEQVDYKMLTRTSLGLLKESIAVTSRVAVSRRIDLPLRPTECTIRPQGVSWVIRYNDGYFNSRTHGSIDFFWKTRNKLTETGRLLKWGDNSVIGEDGYETRILLAPIIDTGSLVKTGPASIQYTPYEVSNKPVWWAGGTNVLQKSGIINDYRPEYNTGLYTLRAGNSTNTTRFFVKSLYDNFQQSLNLAIQNNNPAIVIPGMTMDEVYYINAHYTGWFVARFFGFKHDPGFTGKLSYQCYDIKFRYV